MNQLTTQELEAIRKRAEQATEGPWKWDEDYLTYRKSGMLEPLIWAGRHGDILVDENDADFIAAARTDIPKLLAEVDRLNDKIGFYLDEFERRQKRYDDLARKQAINGGD